MRKRIKSMAQYLILTLSCYNGIFFTYTFIWFLFGLPATRLAMIALSLFAVLSLYGLFEWMKGDVE
jgi:hypothetical protein